MSRVLWALGGYALFVAAVFLLVGTRLDLQEAERRANDAAARVTITQAAYAESLLAYKKDTVRVTRWATRYDTLRLAWERGNDSASVPDLGTNVPTLGSVLEAADSTIAACRSLVVSTRGALTACDSVQSALKVERDAYKNLYTLAQRKPRLGGSGEVARDALRGDLRGALDGEARLYKNLHVFGRAEHTVGRDTSFSRLWYGGRWKF